MFSLDASYNCLVKMQIFSVVLLSVYLGLSGEEKGSSENCEKSLGEALSLFIGLILISSKIVKTIVTIPTI